MNLRENYALRRMLDQITEHFRPEEHACLVDAIKSIHPHSITLQDEPADCRHTYNCFMFALGIRTFPPDLIHLAVSQQSALPNSAFVAHLIATAVLSPAEEGMLVIYGEPPVVLHAGLRSGNAVISKWGSGRLWRHGVDELPMSYGRTARFFSIAKDEQVLSHFRSYLAKLLQSA